MLFKYRFVSPFNKELSNKELSRAKFAEFLAKQKPGMVAFEACATAHYWARCAVKHGHEVKIIPALSVAPSGKAIKPIKMMRRLLQKQLIAQT